ncbi:MAG: hypothetical protein K6F56_09495 [Oscillospiraceae bacterium]|nr:hypothetical protein [Oscillospiraceae bacterium]
MTVTLYSILHGPEIWLAIAGLCLLAIAAGAVGCLVFALWKEEDDEHKNDL